MTQQALAVYERGTLKLLGPVPLTEQQKVRVEITAVDEATGWLGPGVFDRPR